VSREPLNEIEQPATIYEQLYLFHRVTQG